MYKISYLSRAQKELNEAIEWYEDKQEGLGKRFLKEVQKKLEFVKKQPDYYAIRQNFSREVKVQDFPYHIIYRVDEQRKVVVIQSVFHTRRNPQNKYRL
jgi:plasmid stabilization system protein ParE